MEEGGDPHEAVDDVKEEGDLEGDVEEGGDPREDLDVGVDDQAGAGPLPTEAADRYDSTPFMECAAKVL